VNSRWLLPGLVVALLLAVVFLLFETRRLAELAGGHEVEAERLRTRSGAEVREPLPAPAPMAPAPMASPTAAVVDGAAYTELLSAHVRQRDEIAALKALVEQRNAELAAHVQAAEHRTARSLRGMPEGVRQCLNALHERLRAEGFLQYRFLEAWQLDDDGLHDVELLETEPDGLGVTFYRAGRLTLSLDRATRLLELRLFDGTRATGGERLALPADGFVLRLRDVDGPEWERRLPYLVRATGAYPAGATEDSAAARLDPALRRQWIRRLDRLLEAAGSEFQWRVTGLRGLGEGGFEGVDLVATDDLHMVRGSAHCGRLAVEVDRRAGVVSLWMRDGVLRKEGVESSITAEGFRMLLPHKTPEIALDAMFGMVVER
jgi:hypothetical protein